MLLKTSRLFLVSTDKGRVIAAVIHLQDGCCTTKNVSSSFLAANHSQKGSLKL